MHPLPPPKSTAYSIQCPRWNTEKSQFLYNTSTKLFKSRIVTLHICQPEATHVHWNGKLTKFQPGIFDDRVRGYPWRNVVVHALSRSGSANFSRNGGG
jgi:hypothetical protein